MTQLTGILSFLYLEFESPPLLGSEWCLLLLASV